MASLAASIDKLRTAILTDLGALPLTLLALTACTGVVDAVCFLGLGQVFTANMTGNVAILGFALAGGAGLSAAASGTSLGVFLVGAVIGGRWSSFVGDRRTRWIGSTLLFEIGLIAAAAGVASGVDPSRLSAASYVAIALLAGAMGMRTATARRLAIPDLTTTVLTMALTGLASDSRLAGGTGERAVRRVAAVLAMLVGAAVGTLLLRENLVLPLVLAALLTLVALAVYASSDAGRQPA